MSDLQCPAEVLLVAHERLGPGGSVPALEATHYAGIFVVSAIAGEFTREHANCTPEIIAGVVDGASLARALQDLADLHRGYTILVVATHAMIRDMLGRASDSTQPIVLAIDSSGWAVREAH